MPEEPIVRPFTREEWEAQQGQAKTIDTGLELRRCWATLDRLFRLQADDEERRKREVRVDVEQLVRSHFFTAGNEARVENALREAAREAVGDEARAHVREVADQAITDHLYEAVAHTIEEGWQRTDSYGSPRGERMGVKDRVGEMLTKASRHGSGRTMAEELMREEVRKALHGEFGKVTKKLTAEFREMVEGDGLKRLRSLMAQAHPLGEGE